MTCTRCGAAEATIHSNLCRSCHQRPRRVEAPFLPPEDGRDHFQAGLDDWDRDADSRAADRELGDE